ncbi:Heme/hemopexin transporter protein HuxB precursor [compost metagenome]
MIMRGRRPLGVRGGWVAASVLLASGAIAPQVMAQTASQITPPTYAPQPAQTRPPILLPESGSATAPLGAETLDITLADVVVDGGAPDPVALAELKARLVGRPIKVSEIFAAARALEADYARAGHVLRRVVVPAQRLEDGATLRIAVVEGYIESIDTSRVPQRQRARVARLLAPMVGMHDLSMATIERRLLLAGDTPGVLLRSTLAAGGAPGATVMVVEATTRPVSGFLAYDNSLASGLGRDSYGFGLDLNSVLGLGEQVYVRVSGLPSQGETGFSASTPRNRALAGGLIIPIGDDGLSFNLEGVDARTAPKHPAALPGFASRFQRISGRLSYPFIRSRALTLSGELAFDAQNERLNIVAPLTLPLSQDRLRIFRLAGAVSARLPSDGTVNARIEGALGIDGLGARSAADATPTQPLSRQGADAAFEKLELQVALDQPLATHLFVAVAARAQTAFGQAMANAEQFGIATSDGISPLPSGQVQGDGGYVVRAEMRAPFAFDLGAGRGQIAPYVFGAVGGVHLAQPTVFERRETTAHAYGVGVRVAGVVADGAPGLSAGVEYGRAEVQGLPRETERLGVFVSLRF